MNGEYIKMNTWNQSWKKIPYDVIKFNNLVNSSLSLCSLVSYRVKHSKRNSKCKRTHVLFSIKHLLSQDEGYKDALQKYKNKNKILKKLRNLVP